MVDNIAYNLHFSPSNLPRIRPESIAAGRLQKVPLCLSGREMERGKQGVKQLI